VKDSRTLPFRATTESGKRLDIEFPLHPGTQEVVRVNQLVTAVLEGLDRDIKLAEETSNGDILQALAMVTAIRARLLPGDFSQAQTLVAELLGTAMDAVERAELQGETRPPVGHA
jgi:hypothetical protein